MGSETRKQGSLVFLHRERPACPFYGFGNVGGRALIDSKGNQCALRTDSYSPCQMEMAGKDPNWKECDFNTEQYRNDLVRIADNVQVFPEELLYSTRGLSLSQWMNYITNRTPAE